MAPKVSFAILLVILLVPSGSKAHAPAPAPTTTPFDIVKILSAYREFSVFSSLLTQTGLAHAINSRRVVTVLAPNNTVLPTALRRLPRPLLAELLSLHVVLDYLDLARIDALRHGTIGNGSVVTTLFKGTGVSRGLRVAGDDHGCITFSYAGSGGRGLRNNATLVRLVTAQAYHVLVLQVSGLVIPAAVPATTTAPFDITKILSGYPEFRAFSSMLNETGLTKDINGRKVVTILAPNNTVITNVFRYLPLHIRTYFLALHIVLDYLDPARLDALSRGTTGNGSVIPTLLQGARATSSVHVVGSDNGLITFSYTGPGGHGNATLVRVVTAQAYSVLILQVSGLILPAAIPALTAASFDITKILSGYPEFSAFSFLLKKTGLAKAINAHKVVTILAPNNTALPAAVQRLPRPLLADLLGLHVVLDYLNPARLHALRGTTGNGSVVPTLLKVTGATRGLRIAGDDDGCVTFSYAGPGGRGSQNNATLVRVVTTQAHSVLVLQVSGLVIPSAIPATTTAPFHITKILAGYPEFSDFSTLLNKTGMAKVINTCKVVTLLAPNNTALSDAARGLPQRQVQEVLSLHVVLDYLDPERLDALRRNKTSSGSMVTTLLRVNGGGGVTRHRGAGFLCVTGDENGRIMFSSAASGRPRNATLVRVVTSQAFSVVVLQVSGLIVPPSIVKPQQPRTMHMALPPSRAPAPAPQHPPIMPVPTPNLASTAPPAFVVLPIPSVHGGVAAKLSSAAGHRAGSWWSGAGAALGIMACLLGRL